MRIRAMLGCVVMAMATLAIHDAHAETHVKVLGTWPAGDTVTLADNQTFYVHMAYTSDRPVRIWARPYFNGKQANAGSNPSRVYPAGSGEALGWFFLSDPGTAVDEIRIRAGDGSPRNTSVVLTYPVWVEMGGGSAAAGPKPAWVDRLRAADKAAQDADYQKTVNTPPSVGEELFFGGFMSTMFALGLIGLFGPAWGLWRWRGGWRLVAAVPAVVMGFVVLRILVGAAIDPTSHNLWPFEIVMWGGLSCLWMLVAGLVHKFSGAARAA
ncbi:MAG TPA: hypothetical protein VFP92_13545 [Rhodanobacteraceae bacterium]|nr:hypothetical protein [Rhodanobacteraceae bacterium]